MNKLEEHAKLCDYIKELYKNKNTDYGDSVHDTFERFGLTAFLVRIFDKLNRACTLSKQESKVKDESLEDTLIDMANYCLIAVVELRNKKMKKL